MKIDVKKIAKLSNLEISPEEEAEFTTQLNNILSYIKQLNSLDTSAIEPTAQVTGLTNILRNDTELHESLSQNDALAETKNKHNELFIVDKLVETNK